jgi:hypothetical protein
VPPEKLRVAELRSATAPENWRELIATVFLGDRGVAKAQFGGNLAARRHRIRGFRACLDTRNPEKEAVFYLAAGEVSPESLRAAELRSATAG